MIRDISQWKGLIVLSTHRLLNSSWTILERIWNGSGTVMEWFWNSLTDFLSFWKIKDKIFTQSFFVEVIINNKIKVIGCRLLARDIGRKVVYFCPANSLMSSLCFYINIWNGTELSGTNWNGKTDYSSVWKHKWQSFYSIFFLFRYLSMIKFRLYYVDWY